MRIRLARCIIMSAEPRLNDRPARFASMRHVLSAATRRLGYLRYLARRGSWRWFLDRIDYIVADHLQPWSELRIPAGCVVHPTAIFRFPRNIEIGEDVRIQPNCVLWASPNSKIR